MRYLPCRSSCASTGVLALLVGLFLLHGNLSAAEAAASTGLTREAWQGAPHTPVSAEEIDRLVAKELEHEGVVSAPLTTDEQFLRRVWLDLTGRLPMPADLQEFVADKDPHKRARTIDKLLASDDYAEHWGHYWRQVIASHSSDIRALFFARSFDTWMTEQLKANRGWGEITRALITAEGTMPFPQPQNADLPPNGAAYFLLAHIGADAANDRAAETSRVFLGIQIQCAQCHNHPFDQWKQAQFHELAAYYARLAEQPVRDGQRQVGFKLVARPRGEHQMPSKDDPKKGTVMYPRFLDGKATAHDLSDAERRRALADSVVSRDYYWFAAAYTNRIWGELMGQAFCTPVDDLGPSKDVLFPSVLIRLGTSFQATDYDIKQLFRVVMNTQTYQRQIRPGEGSSMHGNFAAATPSRLNAEAVWESLVGVLGPLSGAPGVGYRPFQQGGLEQVFKLEFGFDPSLKPDEVEGSIPQALLLMNNPQINARIRAQGTNLLARILNSYPEDEDAIRMVYLRALARRPTDREMERCREYVKKTDKRAEAYEDLLWALLNSTEFQTKR